MINFRQALERIKSDKTMTELEVDTKSYVRIRRDLKQLSTVLETPYSRCIDDWEKFAWHQRRAMMKIAPMTIMGVLIKRKI